MIGTDMKEWADFRAFCIWYPDLFLDMVSPEEGRIVLDFDQRVFLRSLLRFYQVYGVLPRAYGKTMKEYLGLLIIAILYPNVDLAMSAQTKENAAEILNAKINEIKRFYPILNGEIASYKASKNSLELVLKNSSTITILANAQSTKGQRKHRLNIEEAALLNNELFLDVLEPIPAMPRRTVGKLTIKNPLELNGQIHFLTTAGFKGSDEYERLKQIKKDMVNLKGKFIIGSDWQLACWYGRGPTKEEMLKKKESNTALSFAQNYESIWAGAGDGSLVNISKLIAQRIIDKPVFDNKDDREIYLGIDVARSAKASNNQNAIAVLEVIRNDSGFIQNIDLVNIYAESGQNTFSELALLAKKIFFQVNARGIVYDSNGLGVGLMDEFPKEHRDENGRVYPCFLATNIDMKPENSENIVRCLYDLKPQSANTEVIVNFIDSVDSKQLRLLVKKQFNDYDVNSGEQYEKEILPYFNTDIFLEEVANLKLKQNGNGKGYSIVKNLSKFDKDRWAAVAYGIWYIRTFHMSKNVQKQDLMDYIITAKSKPKGISRPSKRNKSRFFGR